MSRALDEDLLKELECPVCMQYMEPPIKFCKNGHNICSKCRERVQCCPTCRAEFLETRNVALENIARTQKYPCANRRNGCLELFSVEHISKHQADCVYGKIKCPLHLSKVSRCSWNGLKSDLKNHAKAAHPKYLLEGTAFHDASLSDCLGIVSCFGELFTYRKEIRDGRYYAAVQLIGSSSEDSKYKCEYRFSAANGIEEISKTFLVQGYSGDFGTIFNSAICLCLDEKTAKHFLNEEKLKINLKLSKV